MCLRPGGGWVKVRWKRRGDKPHIVAQRVSIFIKSPNKLSETSNLNLSVTLSLTRATHHEPHILNMPPGEFWGPRPGVLLATARRYCKCSMSRWS